MNFDVFSDRPIYEPLPENICPPLAKFCITGTITAILRIGKNTCAMHVKTEHGYVEIWQQFPQKDVKQIEIWRSLKKDIDVEINCHLQPIHSDRRRGYILALLSDTIAIKETDTDDTSTTTF